MAFHIRWQKYWSFSNSPSNGYSGLISFRIDWFDLLAVHGNLKQFSSALHFKSIDSLPLSFLYGPTLIFADDYWKNHSFDCMDLCQQCLYFLIWCLGLSQFSLQGANIFFFFSKEQTSSNFMAAVNICSDFGAQENKIFHCFHSFPFYLPWRDGTRCHDIHFWMLSFKPAFSLSSFTFIKRLFNSSSLSAIYLTLFGYF